MNQNKSLNIIQSFLALLSVSAIGCAQTQFAADTSASETKTNGATEPSPNGTDLTVSPDKGPSCRTVINSITTPVKFLMVVDTSGSNANEADGHPATDPNKSFRGGSISSFFNTYKAKTNFSWGFITFSNDSVRALIQVNGNFGFSTATAMLAAINTFYTLVDYWSTPYELALDSTYSSLAFDGALNTNVKYVVVFISDGRPDPFISDTKLQFKISSIMNKAPGRVTFNTVYYGDANADASDRLKRMAVWGGGKFFDANVDPAGRQLEIADKVNIPGVICTD